MTSELFWAFSEVSWNRTWLHMTDRRLLRDFWPLKHPKIVSLSLYIKNCWTCQYPDILDRMFHKSVGFHMSFRERAIRKCLEWLEPLDWTGLDWLFLWWDCSLLDSRCHYWLCSFLFRLLTWSCFHLFLWKHFRFSRCISKNSNLKSWQSSCLTYYYKLYQHKLNRINSFSQQGSLLWYNMAFGHMAEALSIQEVYRSLFYCNSAVKETLAILLMLKMTKQ